MTPRRHADHPVLLLLLGVAVALMHVGLPMFMPTVPAAPMAGHHMPAAVPSATDAQAAPSDHPHLTATPDAVCDHAAHLCAGTVVMHAPFDPPALVAVLPLADYLPPVRAVRGEARGRGPPPWHSPDRYRSSILRI